MKNKLGIKICCENCFCISDIYKDHCLRKDNGKDCKKNNFKEFLNSWDSMEARIKELQEQQFTEQEASTVLVYMKQSNLIIKNENEHIPNIESIFSKLEKMKGE